MSVNIQAEVNPLLQDIEVDLSSSIVYAFSPTAKVEKLQDEGSYYETHYADDTEVTT